MSLLLFMSLASLLLNTVHVCKLLTCRQYMCICVYTYYAWYLLWFKMVAMYWVQFSSFPRASKTNWSKMCLDRNHRGWRATEVTVEVSFAVRLEDIHNPPMLCTIVPTIPQFLDSASHRICFIRKTIISWYQSKFVYWTKMNSFPYQRIPPSIIRPWPMVRVWDSSRLWQAQEIYQTVEKESGALGRALRDSQAVEGSGAPSVANSWILFMMIHTLYRTIQYYTLTSSELIHVYCWFPCANGWTGCLWLTGEQPVSMRNLSVFSYESYELLRDSLPEQQTIGRKTN